MPKKLLEQVKAHLDLNIYEAKVFLALLSRGICAAGEVADISGVPRSRCYDVLEGLEKKGFVFQKIGKPIKYIAVAPADVLETLKREARTEGKRKLSLLDEMSSSDVLGELKLLYDSSSSHFDSTDISTLLTGKNSINLFLKEMLSGARQHVLIHTNEEGAKRKNKILRKSTRVKASIHAPIDELKNRARNATLVKAEKPMRMVQVDNEQVLFFTSPHETEGGEESALWVKSPLVAETFRRLLE